MAGETAPLGAASTMPLIGAESSHPLNGWYCDFWANATKTVDTITSNKMASVITMQTGNRLDVSVADPTQINTGTIAIDIAKTAASVISHDPQITVMQLSPTIKLSVNVNGAKGSSIKASLQLQ